MRCKIEAQDVLFVAEGVVREEALFQNDIYQVGETIGIEVKANVTFECQEIKSNADAVSLFFSDDEGMCEQLRSYLLKSDLAPSIIIEKVTSFPDPGMEVVLSRADKGAKNTVVVKDVRMGVVTEVQAA